MNFLNKINLDDELIKNIKENNSEKILLDLDTIEKDALGAYKMLIEKGIKNINDILIYHIDILFRDLNELENLLTEKIVSLINEDINNINIIDTL